MELCRWQSAGYDQTSESRQWQRCVRTKVSRCQANVPATVTLVNNDDQTEEFDSTALKIEKVVPGHSTGIMRWRPLAPGRYPFMGEFHAETAQGL